MKNQNKMQGVLWALFTATVSGFAIFYSKVSVAKIDPLVLATARNLFVGFAFASLLLLSSKLRELTELKKSSLAKLILIGTIGGSIPFYLFFSGIRLIGAQQANLIHKSLFIWVAVLAAIFLKEKINVWHIISGLFIIIGTYVFAPFGLSLGTGELLVLTATLMWSAENIIAKKVLREVSSETTGLFRMGLGGLVLFLLTVVSGKAPLLFSLDRTQLATVMIGGGILFFYVYGWFKALRLAPASLVTAVLTFSLVVGNLLNGTFAGMRLTAGDIYSTVLVAAGACLITGIGIKELKHQ